MRRIQSRKPSRLFDGTGAAVAPNRDIEEGPQITRAPATVAGVWANDFRALLFETSKREWEGSDQANGLMRRLVRSWTDSRIQSPQNAATTTHAAAASD